MKEITKEIKENLEELFESSRIYLLPRNVFYERYLASLSKQGYNIQEYKNKYYKIHLEKSDNESKSFVKTLDDLGICTNESKRN